MDERDAEEELRARGLELQALLPRPRWPGPSRRERPSDRLDLVGAILEFGPWSLLLIAAPALAVRVVRRLRRR